MNAATLNAMNAFAPRTADEKAILIAVHCTALPPHLLAACVGRNTEDIAEDIARLTADGLLDEDRDGHLSANDCLTDYLCDDFYFPVK